MKTKLRSGLLGLVGAVGGFALSGCPAQPTPECTVTNSAAAQFLYPYYTLLEKVDSTGGGTCGDLTHMYVGMNRYRTKASGGDFKVGMRASFLVDPALGYIYTANTDATNDCVNEEACDGADDPTTSCVVNVDDGGIELFDGSPVVDVGMGVGEVGDVNDGGFEVDLANECGVVEEPLPRVDPADPDGKNLTIIAAMPQFPTAGRCSLTPESGGTMNFQAETALNATFPAITYAVEFSNVSVINNAEIPGIAFTGNVKLTEGSCVANYKATGFWSGYGFNTVSAEIPCTPSNMAEKLSYAVECDPDPDVDAGRVYGSGMSPALKPLCDRDLQVCVPSIDLTAVK